MCHFSAHGFAGILPGTWQKSLHFNFTVTLQDRQQSPHFPVKETEAQGREVMYLKLVTRKWGPMVGPGFLDQKLFSLNCVFDESTSKDHAPPHPTPNPGWGICLFVYSLSKFCLLNQSLVDVRPESALHWELYLLYLCGSYCLWRTFTSVSPFYPCISLGYKPGSYHHPNLRKLILGEEKYLPKLKSDRTLLFCIIKCYFHFSVEDSGNCKMKTRKGLWFSLWS